MKNKREDGREDEDQPSVEAKRCRIMMVFNQMVSPLLAVGKFHSTPFNKTLILKQEEEKRECQERRTTEKKRKQCQAKDHGLFGSQSLEVMIVALTEMDVQQPRRSKDLSTKLADLNEQEKNKFTRWK
jgi:hypothetical protein